MLTQWIMTSILKISKLQILLLGCIASLMPFFAGAQNSLSLSVSPTLFEMTANPAQEWTSSVRIINSNPYEIVVYADAVNFTPQGVDGQPKFVPVSSEEQTGQTLAEWVILEKQVLVIPAEQTLEIPFTITVPEEASPGGHYAALMIGTKPPTEGDNVPLLQTSQVVTSLIFLRVTGDVIEDGRIREFRSLYSIAQKPEMSFELAFENKGNVHILPQGEIVITNMWGQERGIIPVNRQLLFGNVLPDQIRKYTFAWSGEWSLADIGRYKAVATLAYGVDSRKFSDMETAFWVIPWKILLTIILALFGFIAVFTWAIKLYIRKVLALAGVQQTHDGIPHISRQKYRQASYAAPLEAGMLDLRGHWERTSSIKERVQMLGNFVFRYKVFFLVCVMFITLVGIIIWYIGSASESERAYDVTVGPQNQEITISSEEVKYQKLKDQSTNGTAEEFEEDSLEILIVNRSGISGLAVDLRLRLESEGYNITEIKNDLGVAEDNTVIVYDPAYAEEALLLSQKIFGALLSSFEPTVEGDVPITVYVGKDLENAVE